MFTVYSRDNCVWCDRTKDLLTERGLHYVEVKLNRDITKDDFLAKFPSQKTLPLIFHDSFRVGGFEDLKQYLTVQTKWDILPEV